MLTKVAAFTASLLTVSLVAHAQPEAARPREVLLAEKLGQAIFVHDNAASLATDALHAWLGKDDPTLRGWLSLGLPKPWLVRFIRMNDSLPCAAFDVTIRSRPASVKAPEPCQALTATQHAMYRARTAALQQLRDACPANYNTVVLPGSLIEKSGWLVYLLAATSTPGEIVVGGHLRFVVATDGSRVLERTKLSNSCLTVPPCEDCKESVGAVVSHVISPYPIETHVFLSLLHQKPIYVVTERGMWRVSEGRITFLMTPAELQKSKVKATGGS